MSHAMLRCMPFPLFYDAIRPIYSLVFSDKRVEVVPETIHSTQLSETSWLQPTSDRTARIEEIDLIIHVVKAAGAM